jgi:Uma2 family endonuclease
MLIRKPPQRAPHASTVQSPDGDKYAEVRTLRAGDVLRPAALPDLAITVAEILPEA